MKNSRPALAAALAVSAALLFAGCASGGSSEPSSAAQDCDSLRSEVRDINNGAQNTLNGDLSEGQDEAKDYLDSLGERVDALEEDWSDDEDVTGALDTFGEKIAAGNDYIDSVPTDGSDPDADALATVTGDISDSAEAVNDACTAE